MIPRCDDLAPNQSFVTLDLTSIQVPSRICKHLAHFLFISSCNVSFGPQQCQLFIWNWVKSIGWFCSGGGSRQKRASHRGNNRKWMAPVAERNGKQLTPSLQQHTSLALTVLGLCTYYFSFCVMIDKQSDSLQTDKICPTHYQLNIPTTSTLF